MRACIILVISFMAIKDMKAQDMVNFYLGSPLVSNFIVTNTNVIPNFNHSLIFSDQVFRAYNLGTYFNSANYDGEYEMCLLLHP